VQSIAHRDLAAGHVGPDLDVELLRNGAGPGGVERVLRFEEFSGARHRHAEHDTRGEGIEVGTVVGDRLGRSGEGEVREARRAVLDAGVHVIGRIEACHR